MKNFLVYLMITIYLLGLISTNVNADSDKGYFVVTAYYSPLPNQDKYLTGDYVSEKRLNGQGIAGASGKSVFSGMLAAPKNYKFGTKIYLEGLGIGEVSDRGGAIVNAGNRGYSYDRIDVWMGYGDEGLRRALYWGKRTIKGKIISTNSEVSLDYNNILSPKWATNGLSKVSDIFSKGLGKGSSSISVKKLQNILKETNLYFGEIDGVYNSEIINIIYNFQISNKLITSGSSYGAGYWGKATRKLFLKKYLNGEFDKEEVKEIILEDIMEYEKENSKKTENTEETNQELDLSIFESAANNSSKVIKVQKVLKELNLYNGKETGIYKDIIDSIYDFQLSKGVVKSISTPGAGSYGPKTRAALKKYYIEFKENEEKLRLAKSKKEAEEKAKKEEAEKRKKELEDKYNKLEELALKQANNKISIIGNVKFGEISHNVRELQKTLKILGYFNLKDTAIYGNKTKESIIAYQLEKNIISSKEELGAGLLGPKTKKSLKNDIMSNKLKELVETENINKEELASLNKA